MKQGPPRASLLAAMFAAAGVAGLSQSVFPKQRISRVPADSESGRRSTSAPNGNAQQGNAHQGAKEIARRLRQLERAKGGK